MNLEEFKVLSKDQLKEYGDKIPLGYQYDDNNKKLLTYKNSDGYWSEYTYDENNNELTYKNSDEYWNEYTYNDNHNELTHKNSDGYWSEYTYDENNNILTHKSSDGINSINITKGNSYTLWYDIKNKNYIAGCKNLSYNQCIKYFDKNKDDHKDAELFMKAIEEHHNSLTHTINHV